MNLHEFHGPLPEGKGEDVGGNVADALGTKEELGKPALRQRGATLPVVDGVHAVVVVHTDAAAAGMPAGASTVSMPQAMTMMFAMLSGR